MKQGQKGFSVVEILIVIIVLGVIGGTGWYVRQSNSNKPASTDTSQSSKVEPIAQTQQSTCSTSKEEQKSWVVATSHENSFSMCIPGGWTLAYVTDESEEFYIAPPFEIAIDKKASINQEEMAGPLDGTADSFQVFKANESYQGWTSNDAEKSSFALSDGTKGTRYYTKYTNLGEGIGPVEGEEDYEYLFEKNGKFIHAVYTIHPGTEKHLDTIEEVLKTLKIN